MFWLITMNQRLCIIQAFVIILEVKKELCAWQEQANVWRR